MKVKMYKAILHVKKTEEQVREIYKDGIGPPATDEEIMNSVKFYDLLDGTTGIVSSDLSLMPGEYAYLGATEEYSEREKEACYLKEQDLFFGTYINQREEFDADWESGNYSPEGTMHLTADEVEIIGEI